VFFVNTIDNIIFVMIGLFLNAYIL
jgi:hypothetical protein